MPALISFAVQSGGAGGKRGERVQVREDPQAVVKKLVASKSGFASFALARKSDQSIWVNRDHVLSVRSAPSK